MSESTTAILKSLLEFFVVFGSFYIPCLIGAMVSMFIKRDNTIKDAIENKKRVPKFNFKKTLPLVLMSAILPTIFMAVLYDSIQQKVSNGVVLMALAALFGAIGDDLRRILKLKGIIAIIKIITNGISEIGQIEDALEDNNSNIDNPPTQPIAVVQTPAEEKTESVIDEVDTSNNNDTSDE